MHFKKSHLLLLLPLAVLVCSCGKHKYLQVSKDSPRQNDTLYLKSLEEYKLQPADILYVNVLTKEETFADLFNKSSSQQQMTNVSASYLYLSGYPIDLEGCIELPVVGKISVAGLTVPEVEQLVHQKVTEIAYESQVIVRLVSFRISIVGEVKLPGEYTVYRDQATILQALSLAGDMNYYGDRKKVMVYRTTKYGTIPYSIDLTDRNALSSPLFYLQPNDLVYIQPLPRTIFRVNVSDMVTYLSAISSSLALVIAILSLTK